MIQLNESNFAESINEGVVVVDFGAPWCGPCRALEPILETLTGAKVCKVNIDDSPRLAQQFGVSAVPTIVFFKDGVKVDTQVGLIPQQTLQQKIESVRAMPNAMGKASVYDEQGRKIGEEG